MSDTANLITQLDAQIAAAEALHIQLYERSDLDQAPLDAAAPPDFPATIEIKMKAGKSWGWLAKAIGKQMEGHPEWKGIKGGALKTRMGSTMLYRNKVYTFGTAELLGSGPLSGGMSSAEIEKAQKAADWWQKEGKARWQAKRDQEEAEKEMAEQMKAEAEDDALRKKWEAENGIIDGQSLQDPEELAAALKADQEAAEKAAREQAAAERATSEKKKLLKELMKMMKHAKFLRKTANSSAVYYMQSDRWDSEQTDRMVKKMEDTRDGADTLHREVMTSYAHLVNDDGSPKSDTSIADIQKAINTHRRTTVELEIDLSLETEKQKPNTSIGGALEYTATATGVATSAAVTGALSEVPVVGEAYERLHGADQLKELRSTAGAALNDSDMADHAVDSGNLIGRGAMTVVTVANPANVAVIADNVGYGLVEGVTGEDVATGRELSDGERALGVLNAVASGSGALSKVDSTTQFNNAVGVMNNTKAAPTLVSQMANASSASKKAVDIADNATATITGHRLLRPEDELTTTERVLSGVSATASASELAANSTQTGKFHTATDTKSTAQLAAERAKSTVKHVKTADKVVTASTGYSVLKEDEVSDKERIKAGVGATSNIGRSTYKTLDETGDDIAKDVKEAMSEVDLSQK